MDFKTTYPEFAAIEEQIRKARAERSVAVAHAIVGLIEVIGRGVRKFGDLLGQRMLEGVLGIRKEARLVQKLGRLQMREPPLRRILWQFPHGLEQH